MAPPVPPPPPALAGSRLLALVWRWAHRLPLAPSYTFAPAPHGEEVAVFRYGPSYLAMRVVIGVVGLLVPVAVVVLDVAVEGRIAVRGSVSAYFFSPSREVFVGCLSAVAFLLVTYMWAHRRTVDFAASLLAGLGVLVVVHAPTRRSSPADEPTWLQSAIGEDPTWVLHVAGAATFVGCSVVLSVVYAMRELRFGLTAVDPDPHAVRRARLYLALAGITLVGVATLLVSTFAGELVAFWAFAVSWLVASRALRSPLRRVRAGRAGRAGRSAALRPRAAPRPPDPTGGAPTRR
ncbi:hypothetical protein [Nocardioides litoris]|uniref:hypothetical protein n=1 Tax=Nocardioides litoris TaxID=1926648 RepID=UPI001123C5F0|nr:hypothetical protein [Nocardioides litoris]